MSLDGSQRTVLLVGATGMLGGAILDALLEHGGLAVRALVRGGKPEAADRLRAPGVEVAEGDVLAPDSLPPAMGGADVVISALHNDPTMFVEGHRNLILAAERAGVKRFIPSDFSIDMFRLREDENFNLAMRLQVAPLFEGRRVRPIHVLNGAFIDTMLDPRAPFVEWDRGVLPYYGDGTQPCDFTSVADAGRYVAAACADPAAPEVLRVAGDVLTMPQFAESVARATGRAIRAEQRGSIDDLARLIRDKQRTATAPWDYLPLQYHHNMVSGRAKLDPLDNARYPHVRPETVEAFARRVGLGNARGLSHSAS